LVIIRLGWTIQFGELLVLKTWCGEGNSSILGFYQILNLIGLKGIVIFSIGGN